MSSWLWVAKTSSAHAIIKPLGALADPCRRRSERLPSADPSLACITGCTGGWKRSQEPSQAAPKQVAYYLVTTLLLPRYYIATTSLLLRYFIVMVPYIHAGWSG